MNFIIGIDLGGTKTSGILLDSGNNVVYEKKIETKTEDQSSVINSITMVVDDILLNNKISASQIKGLGIGVPGHVDYKKGFVKYCPNLPLESLNLKELLQGRYNTEVAIENDANAAAIGEKFFGLAKSTANFVCVAFGTGIGAGIFVNGKLCRGFEGGAGEVGHMILDYSPDAPVCGCGKRGCFESLASGNAIARMAKEMAASDPNPFPATENVSKPFELTAEKIAELASQGNESAIKILKNVSYFIGVGFANLVNLLNPEKIIVTGSAINPEEIILKPAINTMKKLAFSTNAKNVEVVKSENGNKAGLLGAAALCLLEE